MFGRKRRADEKELKLCTNCRFWSDERGVGIFHLSESEGQCRRYPPSVVQTNEHLRIAHEDRRFEKPYIPDRAWSPSHVWPLTLSLEWCGEWSAPTANDENRVAVLRKLMKEK